MANQESILQSQIRLAISSPVVRMFRNNVGSAVTKDGRHIDFGLCRGSSDLIGWSTREITPDMVGRHVAVFTAIEIKTKTGRISDVQQNFIDVVRKAGGIAGVVRSIEDAKELLK